MSSKDNATPDSTLGMSDEEFMKLDPMTLDDPPNPDETDDAATSEDSSEADDTASDQDKSDDQADEEEEDGDDDAEESDLDDSASADSDSDDDAEADDDKDGTDGAAGDAESDADVSADDKSSEADKDTQDTGELTDAQFAAIGRQVMGEFKAVGGVMKVKSADDAMQLMQMGADYHRKMRGLKPALKTLKLLENNGLMDPEKLNFLIDLNLKKPEAITQLLKDSKLDPMELDLQGEETYVPDNRTVSDTEMMLDEVLDSISQTKNYQRTLTVVGEEWDQASRGALAQDPTKIRVINQHMETGIFDQVAQAVNYERSLGKLVGVSDYDAYLQIGQRMHENNEFRVSGQQGQQRQSNQQDHQQSQQKSNNTAEDEARTKKKKAASPNRQKPGGDKGDKKYDPLNMPDEEFAKLNNLNL